VEQSLQALHLVTGLVRNYLDLRARAIAIVLVPLVSVVLAKSAHLRLLPQGERFA